MKELTDKQREEFGKRVGELLKARGEDLDFEVRDWDDKTWSMLFVCQIGKRSEDELAELVEGIFSNDLKLGEDDYIGFGFHDEAGGYVWVVSHPDIPDEVRKAIDENIENEEKEDAARSRKAKSGPRIPVPRKQKSKGDTVYLVLAGEFFKDIKAGRKNVEYRELNQYYANKLLGRDEKLKYVLLQNGYGGKGRKSPEQMKFRIEEIVYSDDELNESPCYLKDGSLAKESDLPRKFNPTMYGIRLGGKVDI